MAAPIRRHHEEHHPSRKLRSVSVVDAVASSVRERVVAGEFEPGSQLREIEIASEYGVARPTVRAALQRLVMTGLLRREANRSAYVPDLSVEDITDLFSVRGLLETEAVRRLTKTAAQPSRAEQAVRRLERFTGDASWSEVVEADLDFHRSLVAASDSPHLLRWFELLEDEIRLAIGQLRPVYASPAELAKEHRRLLTMIETGTTREALRLMRQHLDQAASDLVSTAPRRMPPELETATQDARA